MTSHARQAIILGLTVTLLVVGIELLGAFKALERDTIGLRFAYARWRSEPLDNQIRFVDIDDGALYSVGRWPWPRSRLADALDELRLAGVRTIAIDLLLDDTEAPEYQPNTIDPIDHDANLAKALKAVQCVLAVRVAERLSFDEVWHTKLGTLERLRLLDELSYDIQLEAELAAKQAGLTGPRLKRFLARPLEFKKIAAYEKLQQLSKLVGDDLKIEDFIREIAPGVDEHTGDYPERRLLTNAWRQHQAWLLIWRFLLPSSGLFAGSYRDIVPLPRFAENANAIGFINRQNDPDGELRSIVPLMPGADGQAVQFGLAAAALHLGRPLTDILVDNDRLVLGSVELPLIQGQLWLAWPTTRTDWSGVVRQIETDPLTAGRISIGRLISLANERRKLASLTEQKVKVSREIAEYLGLMDKDAASDAVLSTSTMYKVRDWVNLVITDEQELIAQGESLTEKEKDDIGSCSEWHDLDQEIPRGIKTIADAEAELRAELNDKLVFIGIIATAAGTDSVPTPLGSETPGVVVHAVVADMALSGRRVRLVPFWLGWALAVSMGLLCTSLAARLTPAYSTMFVLVLLTGYVAIAGWWFFGSIGSVFPMVAPVTAGAGSWMACTALKAILFQRDRRRITRRFKSRVAPQLVDYLIENPNTLSMTGEQREITIMFLDIAGFTAITESLDGPITVGALNQCMSELTSHITHHHGYVNKFLGDGLMAFWSAFLYDPEQAVRACTSALECREGLMRLNRSNDFANLPSFSARFGIATGQVIVGDCGAPPQLNDYTVIGNEVNLAARLESANKLFGTSILITDRTRNQLGNTELQTRPLGRVIVVGQTVPVSIHELLPSDADSTMIDLTTQAVEAFASHEYPDSADAWNRLTDTFGPSKLADYYLKAIADPERVVNGALRLHEK